MRARTAAPRSPTLSVCFFSPPAPRPPVPPSPLTHPHPTMAGAPLAAVKMFAARGTAATRANPATEIACGLALGFVGAMAFKSWHWGERKKIDDFYKQLNAGK